MNHVPFSDTGMMCGLISTRALHVGCVSKKHKNGVQPERAHLALVVAQK
tara:strand:- start:293 stop:439 length:147 start_codon:yes stop_codon:yes gene_type:complete